LQEGEIQRVGSSVTIKVNVRMLAATNKPLEEMVGEKTFREDLYYRLNVVRIQLPPLRKRMEDVPLLVDFALKRLSQNRKAHINSISPEVMAVLMKYDWPGNVRELENIIYRSAVMAQSDTILMKDLPGDILTAVGAELPAAKLKSVSGDNPDAEAAESAGGDETAADEALLGVPGEDPFDSAYRHLRTDKETNILEHAERELIRRALDECKGKQVKAAEILGMTRATLRKRIDQYDLKE